MDTQRLAIAVTNPDGSTRWAYDEADGTAIPGDLAFGTSAPGGHKDASCSLLRGLDPFPDERLFAGFRVYGPGNQTVWDGRIVQLPRQSGPGQVSPGAVGWGSHLEDFSAFMEVYADRDTSHWEEPELVRRVAIAAGGYSQGAVPVASQNGGLAWTPAAGQALAAFEHTELIYKAPAGATLGKLQYRGTQTGTWTNFAAPAVHMSTTPQLAVISTDTLTLDDTVRSVTLPAGNRYAVLRSLTTGGVTPGGGMARTYSKLAVYGNHGLTLRTTVAGDPDGVYASDVVANIVSRAAPLLTFTTGGGGTIQPTTFAIPHLVIDSPTTAAEAIARANAYHSWDWLVWDDRTFYYQPPGAGTEWQARIGDGASLSLEGDAAEQIINGIVIVYQDNGIQKYAGPIGSGLDVESAALQDTSSTNPVNAAGIPKKWAVQTLSVATTDAGAVQIGSIMLKDHNTATRRGQMTLTGLVRHPTEGMVPAWRIRAGDTVRLTDRPGDLPRRIVETSYRHGPRQITLSLDQTPHTVEAIVERLVVTGQLIS